ncbi:hypothetical protein [Spirosoma panaciterrae]|uniref:hypothetical protein n=1 Tax=Spirosoma panaciterrae TaxID=496058 RepID=UPI00035E26A1|nr:hypothetical protein [Spirosoma panaciterrae]
MTFVRSACYERCPIPVKRIESNPLVEENRNQVAVKRGSIVYCLELADNLITKQINPHSGTCLRLKLLVFVYSRSN